MFASMGKWGFELGRCFKIKKRNIIRPKSSASWKEKCFMFLEKEQLFSFTDPIQSNRRGVVLTYYQSLFQTCESDNENLKDGHLIAQMKQ